MVLPGIKTQPHFLYFRENRISLTVSVQSHGRSQRRGRGIRPPNVLADSI